MKVECAACQAKYQIPDERVVGRKLKIRCRKCGGAIIVRGDQLVAPVEETTQQAPSGYGDGEWHVSLDGQQHGPYPTAQMASMLRNGQLAWDAHIWRDGYADWRTAGDSDTLVRAVAANAEAAADDDGPTRMVHGSSPPDALRPVARSAFAQRAVLRASQPPVAAEQDYEQQPYASQPPVAVQQAYEQHYASQPPVVQETYEQLQYEQQQNEQQQYEQQQYEQQHYEQQQQYEQQAAYGYAANDGGYGQPAQYGGGNEFGGYAHPRVGSAQAMTGERNEDSVLFSAQNLQKSASVSSLPQARGGHAAGEGSGLIDIRALAALARTTQAPGSSAPRGSNGYSNGNGHAHGHARSADEMLAIANQTGAFSRLDSLAPFDRPARSSNNAVPLAIVAGSAMVAAAAFLGVYLTRGSAPAPVAVAAEAPVAVAATAQPMAAPEAQAAAEPADEAAKPDEAADEPAAGDERAAPVDDSAAAAAADREVAEAQRAAATSSRSSGRGRASKRERGARAAKGELSAEKARPEKVKPEKAAPEEASAKKSASIDDLLLADAKPEPKAAPAPAPDPLLEAPAKKAAPSGSRSIDDLLDGAVDKGDKKPAAAAPAADSANAGAPAGASDTPDRAQIKTAMKSVEADVKACAEGQTLESPSAVVAISVTGATGRVSSVRVTGIQGAVGSCIARAVRNATFPKFSKETLSINFPFRLK
jgi:predicted Zn finger-like uncharacterized protein